MTVVAGDTVTILPGTYARGMNIYQRAGGTANNPITFTAQAGVVLTGVAQSGLPNDSLAAINVELSGGYWIFDGFDIQSDGTPQRACIRINTTNYVTVKNCTANHGFIGIFFSSTTGTLIENNVCSNSTDQHGIYCAGGVTDCVVRGNICFGNNWDGIHLNALTTNPNIRSIIERNRCYENNLSGMDVEGVTDAIIRNNICHDNGKHGIVLHSLDQPDTPPCSGVVIHNNTIVGTNNFGLQFAAANDGQICYNNIILEPVSPIYGAIGTSTFSNPTALRSDYNILTDRFSTDLGVGHFDLATWRATTGQDAHSITASPDDLFTDYAARDFTLKPSSFAINFGVQSFQGKVAPTKDYAQANRPQGSGFDAGAYEAVAGTSSPVSPSSLTATAIDPFSIRLVWVENSTNANGVTIERSTDGGTNWSTLITLAPNLNGYTDTGLTTGQSYSYRVSAFNWVGSSAASNTATAIGPVPPITPPTPTATTVSLANTAVVTVSWVCSSTNVTAFHVERSDDGVSWSEIATTASNATSYSDTTVTTTHRYKYRVRAENSTIMGSYGPIATTITGHAIPGTYTLFNPSDAPPDTPGIDNTALNVGVTLAVRLRFDYPGLITAVRFYKPPGAAQNVHRVGVWSSDHTLLAATDSVGETASGWQQVNFDAPIAASANTDYIIGVFINDIYYSTPSYFTSAVSKGPVHAPASGDGGGQGLYGYQYYIDFPGNTFNASNYWVDAVLLVTAASPVGPSSLTISSSGGGVDLAWLDNSTEETGFKIERSTNSIDYSVIATVAYGINTYHDSTTIAGTVYYYRVRATSDLGDSGASNVVSTATNTIPDTPSFLAPRITAEKIAVKLQWEAVDGIVAYNVYKDGDSVPVANALRATDWSEVVAADGSSHTYAIEAVTPLGQVSSRSTMVITYAMQAGNGTVLSPLDVRAGVSYADGLAGLLDIPQARDVRNGVLYDHGTKVGTLVAPEPPRPKDPLPEANDASSVYRSIIMRAEMRSINDPIDWVNARNRATSKDH
jgi:fibronectin type 3 domain-containing protein